LAPEALETGAANPQIPPLVMMGIVGVPIASSFFMVLLEIWKTLTMVTYTGKAGVAVIVRPVLMGAIPLLPRECSAPPELESSDEVFWESFELSEIADKSEVAHETPVDLQIKFTVGGD
jgi:hypothetical protein